MASKATAGVATVTDALHGEAGAIGPQLRSAREKAGISVRELARRTGMSPSLISQVENGKVLPSLATLFKLTNELGTRVNAMIFGEPARDAVVEVASPVVTRGAGEHIALNSGVTWERLTPRSDEHADFLLVTYAVGGSSCEGAELMRHNGREYGHVLSGSLAVTVGFNRYVLKPGDSISFDSTTPHRLETVGPVEAKAIWFVTGRGKS